MCVCMCACMYLVLYINGKTPHFYQYTKDPYNLKQAVPNTVPQNAPH